MPLLFTCFVMTVMPLLFPSVVLLPLLRGSVSQALGPATQVFIGDLMVLSWIQSAHQTSWEVGGCHGSCHQAAWLSPASLGSHQTVSGPASFTRLATLSDSHAGQWSGVCPYRNLPAERKPRGPSPRLHTLFQPQLPALILCAKQLW